MIKNFRVFTVLFLLIPIVLIGCVDDEDTDNEPKNKDTALILEESYNEKPGDIFTTTSNMHVTYSNEVSLELNSTEVITYTLVDEIPDIYNFPNSKNGPYLLETDKEDGELDGLEYITTSGDTLIEDDLDYFSTSEYTTKNGTDEPKSINIGDTFSYNENSTLFSSQTGIEAGYKILNGDLTVLNQEKLTVPAGTFDAVKLGFSIAQTTSEEDVINTMTGTGFGWFDTTNGFMLKMTMNLSMNLGAYDLTAEASSVTELQNYFISSNNTLNKTNSFSKNITNEIYEPNVHQLLSNISNTINRL